MFQGLEHVSIPHWFDYKLRHDSQILDSSFCFNSTLVRLQVTRTVGDRVFGKFQFHTGSITSKEIVDEIHDAAKVSIPHWFDYKATISKTSSCACSVSIPHWFDYKCRVYLHAYSRICVSIPHWFDYKLEYDPINQLIIEKFQFHTGSITSCYRGRQTDRCGRFQFHTGSITSSEVFKGVVNKVSLFQFHTGSITSDPFNLIFPHFAEFQFHTGSITR